MLKSISLGPPYPTGSPAARSARGAGQAKLIASIVPLGGLADILFVEETSSGFCSTSHRGPGHSAFDGEMHSLRAVECAERMAMHLATEIDATMEQQAQLIAIARSATKDLLPLREQLIAGRTEGLKILRQSTIDRAAIEKLSGEQLARAEEASRCLVSALTAATKVLTPIQRTMFVAARTEEARIRRRWSRKG